MINNKGPRTDPWGMPDITLQIPKYEGHTKLPQWSYQI